VGIKLYGLRHYKGVQIVTENNYTFYIKSFTNMFVVVNEHYK